MPGLAEIFFCWLPLVLLPWGAWGVAHSMVLETNRASFSSRCRVAVGPWKEKDQFAEQPSRSDVAFVL